MSTLISRSSKSGAYGCIFSLFVVLSIALYPSVLSAQAGAIDATKVVILTIDGDTVYRAGASGTLIDDREISGGGRLSIDFDRNALKRAWTGDTRAVIRIRGQVHGRDTAARAIPIPGFAEIGEAAQDHSLNVAAASQVVNRMQQGGEYAAEILLADDSATIASHSRRIGVLDRHIGRFEASFQRTREILVNVYDEAHTYTLLPAGIEEAAAQLVEARAGLDQLQASLDSAGAVQRTDFIRRIENANDGILAWLGALTDPNNRPLVDIMAARASVDGGLVLAEAAKTKTDLEALRGGQLASEREREVKGRLLRLAERIKVLEARIYDHYMGLDTVVVRDRYLTHPASEELAGSFRMNPSGLLYFRDEVADSVRAIQAGANPQNRAPNCGPPTIPPSPVTQTGQQLANRFIRDLRAKTGRNHADAYTATLADEFDRNIAQLLRLEGMRNDLLLARQALRCRTQLGTLIFEANRPRYNASIHAVRFMLLVDVASQMIDDIPITHLNLSDLGLGRGDRLVLDISTVARPGGTGEHFGQTPFELRVVKRGFSGLFPRVTDVQLFAKATDGESDFTLRSGILAMWNWYGKTRFTRALAPGFGVNVAFLQFSERSQDGETVTTQDPSGPFQVGLGFAASLFDNLITFSYGWNLQASAVLRVDDVVKEEGRAYWGIGISLKGLIDQLKP